MNDKGRVSYPVVEWGSSGSSFFWTNVNSLRLYYLISVNAFCEDINKYLADHDMPKELEFAEGKFWYNCRANPQQKPPLYVYEACTEIFSRPWFSSEAGRNLIIDKELTQDECLAVAGIRHPEIIEDRTKEKWAEYFWDNMQFIYSIFSLFNKETSTWGLSKNSFGNLKSMGRLLPRTSMQILAREVGLTDYPLLYLAPFEQETKDRISNYMMLSTVIAAINMESSVQAIEHIDYLEDDLPLYDFTSDDIDSAISGMEKITTLLKRFRERESSEK